MHTRVREYPPTGGASSCAESCFDERLLLYGKKMLDALNWHGLAMVEFNRTPDGDYVIMEVNPRFRGSLGLAVASGVDFPYNLVRLARGEDIGEQVEYTIGKRYQWVITKDLRHVAERRSSLKGFLADLIDPRVKSDIWLSDIMPNLM
ncbi:MAG: ATP-grasp domain-containing protein [Actinobacteria bacterium]|nr:ATP-grasp domain-containing protein [Actinomycetota bacterium]